MAKEPHEQTFLEKLNVPEALTFDDVLLRPTESHIEPEEANTRTNVSKNVELSVPVLSAAMDTVTESEMATEMARQGGIGVLHRNMPIEETVQSVERVKRADELIIRDVVTAAPEQTVQEVDQMMNERGVSGAPVVDEDGMVLGIISGTDIRPYLEVGDRDEVREAMTDEVITAADDVTAREALELMYEHKIERVPIVDDSGILTGLVTMQGILQRREYDDAARDADGRLRVGVAVGPFEDDRAVAADDAGADVLFIDCAHAHNRSVIESAQEITSSVEADVVVGNIGTAEAAQALVDFADGLKVGIGPGSICTTRVVSGAGMPQMTAIANVADVASQHDVPVIADGGIRYSGDAIKAVAAGADAVMLGSYFAGTDEAPGRIITRNGKKYKQYRGMGSVGAMQSGGGDRYLKEADEDEEYVPEGVEAATPYKGSLESELHQLVGGMQSGMGYVGAESIADVKEEAEFVRVSPAGQTEGHPHDVMITDEAPNYKPREN
ncbi:IMP dehydrogenase [Halocatena pleomorpha]|uniref:Inosine-5'-monophosphate dehydrogenase n=1 Tax=Halocatena pleomorpha TaxID=1785090 RepID=A0A3P3RKT7_9EURY|nr:IMP dehydrogenase [Halocatena pleomorpha]RRJ33419.1 IMP dehydrogenase [Halocatena pleomorpha]